MLRGADSIAYICDESISGLREFSDTQTCNISQSSNWFDNYSDYSEYWTSDDEPCFTVACAFQICLYL